MKTQKPIDLLKTHLAVLKSAKSHSKESYKRNDIDLLLHEAHIKNLNPMIEEYEKAIEILIKHL